LYPTRSAHHASSACWPSMMIVAARNVFIGRYKGSQMRGRHGRWLRMCVSVPTPPAVSGTTSYTRNYWLIWHQVIVASRRLGKFIAWLRSAFWSTTDSPKTNTEYAFAALTVLKTRSSGRSHRRPKHYLRVQPTAFTALIENGPSATDHPSKKRRYGSPFLMIP
jgi:hypothetical protein